MKRTVIAPLLGLLGSAAIVSSAHAQGQILLSNYGAATDAPITYGVGFGAKTGTGLDSSFTAGLYYYLGTASEGTSDSIPGGGLPGWELASDTTSFGNPIAGLFDGGVAFIPDYIPGGPITFEVTAFNGSSYVSSTLRAHSAAFTLPSIGTPGAALDEFGPGLQAFSINIVPEPTTLALFGLGGLSLWLFRRRK